MSRRNTHYFCLFRVFSSLSNAMVKRGCDFFLSDFLFSSRLISIFSFFPALFLLFRRCLLPLIIRVYNSCYCHVTIDLEWNIRLTRPCQKTPIFCFVYFFRSATDAEPVRRKKTNILPCYISERFSMLSRQL